MQLRKLDASFYAENSHLVQCLDLSGGNWDGEKIRGYGIVVISINGLTFGIPLRSNIKHDAAYITQRSQVPGIVGKGLDFSKAVLLHKATYISTSKYVIPPQDHQKLRNKAFFITKSFEQYVKKYIKAVKAKDQHILDSPSYRFTTLENYHAELGCL